MVLPKVKKTASTGRWTPKGAVIALIGTVILFSVFDVDVGKGSSLGLDVPPSAGKNAPTRGSSESALIAPVDERRKKTNNSNELQRNQQKDAAVKAAKPAPEGRPLEALARNGTVPVIAYAISLVRCGDRQSSTAGLIDAALVLRHSVHMQSIRNPASGSKYDYQMYAIVHADAVECSHVLKTVGFTIFVAETPIDQSLIRGDGHLRDTIHREWCCGHHEFIKLQAYNMVGHPAVVHVDIDFVFLKPMDLLYDAIIYDKDSPEGKKARSLIPMERPKEAMPDKIQAFITRDWPQVVPGRIPGYQAGFIVLRPDPSVPEALYEIIYEGNYTKGHSRQNGWGGMGYGSFVGAMAMQGLMAYYYDKIAPNAAVELNQCRYNWMGMDVLYRAQPNFHHKHHKKGMCRNDGDYCEQCYETDTELIHNVHFTQCRKPWNCVGLGVLGGNKGKAIDTSAGSYEKCMELVTKWHELRSDFETKLFALTNDQRIKAASQSSYKMEIFHGHCGGEGGGNYSQIDASEKSFARVSQMYEL